MAKERLEVELVAQAQQAISELQKYVKATGQATKEIGEHAKQAKTASEKVGSLTKAIKNYWLEILVAVAAVRKMAQMAGEFIAASNEQERVVSHLNSTLQATGRLTPTIVQSMTDWAGAMQKVTAYSDETIINAQAVLAVYDDIATETFPDVIKAAMDLSTIMGVDLTEATRSLAIALTDPEQGLTRLRRAGILFSDSQKEAIVTMGKTGDSLRAQAMILDVVKGKVGGAAEAYGKTLAGQMDITQQTMDELKETLGDLTKTWMPGFIMEANVMLAVLNRITMAIMGTKTENEKFRESVKGMTKEDLKENITQYDKMIQALANQMAPLDEIIAKNKWLTKEYREAGKQLDVLGPQYKDATLRYYMLQEALKQYAQTHPAAKKATEDTGKAIKELKKQSEELGKTWDEWVINRFGYGTEMITDFGIRAGEVFPEVTEMVDNLGRAVAGQQEIWTTTTETMKTYFAEGAKAWQEGLSYASDYSSQLEGLFQQGYKNRSIEIENEYKKRKDYIDKNITDEVANKEATAALDEEFRIKRGQLMQKEAKTEKVFAIFSSIINTAEAVTKFLAKGRIGLAIAAGVMGAVKTAMIAAQPIPAYQLGGIKKQVGGSMYGDRQPAMLERGERVIPKETASRNVAALNRMEAGEGGGAPVNIYIGGKLLYSTMQRAFRNGQIVVDARAIK